MASTVDLRKEEADLGPWPRRLLHIPSLTSYEWQPGNVYGPAVAPAYNAITYTWGRWKLPDHVKPGVLPLRIHGVSWDVPRIDPTFFTSQELQTIIQRCRTQHRAHWLARMRDSAPVEFLWLDIACIDQRPSEPRSAAEIGRQAAIFKGAQNVYSWLSTFSTSTLQTIFSTLESSLTIFHPTATGHTSATDFDAAILKVFAALQQLSTDPWFSSLWTLQEAFLRQDAVFLSRSGEVVQTYAGIDSHDAQLEDVLSFFEDFHLQREPEAQRIEPRTVTQPWHQVLTLGEKMGLHAMQTQNALTAYSAAGHRTTMRQEDRIYGIQQIFSFRLGKSAVDCPQGQHYTLTQLENQLGEHLLRNYTIPSQVHTYTEPVLFGRGWMMNQKSVIPLVEFGCVNPDELGGDESRPECLLSVREMTGNMWGHFQGRVCPFREFQAMCTTFQQNSVYREIFLEKNFLTLHLDITTELNSFPDYENWGYDQVSRGDGQRMLADWLAISPLSEELVVLFLGYQESNTSAANVGLLLLPKNDPIQHFHRLGFCYWEISYTSIGGEDFPEKPFFEGLDARWSTRSGLFG